MKNEGRAGRQLNAAQTAERSISKKYRKDIWNPFIAGVKRYALIAEGERVAVLITDRSNSLLLGVMMKMLVRYSDFPFEAVYLAPFDFETDREAKLKEYAALLDIPLNGFVSGGNVPRSFREAALHSGCSKAAVGDTADDACILTVSSLLFEGTIRGLLPKEKAPGYENLTLIRPLYCVEEDAVSAWVRYNGLSSMISSETQDPVRTETAELLRRLKKDHPDLKKCIFNSLHSVHRDTFPGFILDGERHSFRERYDGRNEDEDGSEQFENAAGSL